MAATCQGLFVVFALFFPDFHLFHKELPKEEMVSIFIFVFDCGLNFLSVNLDPVAFAFIELGVRRLWVVCDYTTTQQ